MRTNRILTIAAATVLLATMAGTSQAQSAITAITGDTSTTGTDAGGATTSAAAGNGGCTPTWTSVSTPDWLKSGVFGLTVDVLSSAETRISLINVVAPWVLDTRGTSANAMPPIPHAPNQWVDGSDFHTGTHSFDSPDDGWLIGPPFPQALHAARDAAHTVRWHDGHWTITPTAASPDPTNASPVLNDIASISPRDAWAVGGLYQAGPDVVGAPHGTLVEHWDGTQWSIVANPASTQAGAELRALAVVSPTDIWAAGRTSTGEEIRPLVEHWDGHSWRAVDTGTDTGQSQFDRISADGPDDVWIAGDQMESDGLGHSLVEHWNGRSWSVVPGVPDNGGSAFDSGLGITGIYAAAPTDVWATTDGINAPGDGDFFLHFDGAKWTRVPVPGPHEFGRGYVYTAIDGSGPDNVWAVGVAQGGAVVAHLACGRS